MGAEQSVIENPEVQSDLLNKISISVEAPIKPELLQMLHLTLHEIREIYDTYKRRVKGTNMSYTIFTKIIWAILFSL